MAIETTDEQTQVELSDLASAALLLVNGCRLQDVAPSGQAGRQLFVITGPRKLVADLLEAYDRGEARVALVPYLGAQRQLKDRLFRHQRVRGVDDRGPRHAA